MRNRLLRMLYMLVIGFVALFSSMTIYVAMAQSKYVYHPNSSVDYTPDVANLEYENVMLKTEDGEKLHAWFVPCKRQSDRLNLTILFCHGNAGNIGDRIGSLVTFNRLGFDTLIFDYRGYGQSTGTPTEHGTYTDALAAWDYLVDEREILPDNIVVFGRSLGGAVASWIAAHSDPGALILESVFSSAPDMAHEMFPFLPVRLFCRFRYDNVAAVQRVKCPVLVAHGKADRTCPYPHGRRVFDAITTSKRFVEMQGGHNDGGLDSNPHYQLELVAFLNEYLTNDH